MPLLPHFIQAQLLRTSFRCPACGAGAEGESFPLCAGCARCLIPAPRLCPVCASPTCPPAPDPCLRPWARHPAIHSYSAAYLLLSPCYRVLKRWKITGGPLFNRRILRGGDSLRERWRELCPEAVVPVPQRPWRSWSMEGSPSERIARWVAIELGIPVLQALAPTPRHAGARRQAELSGEERYSNPIRFAPAAPLRPGQRLILVDDFMTSGRTLREAATSLRSLGSGEIHLFCLGIRLSRQRSGN